MMIYVRDNARLGPLIKLIAGVFKMSSALALLYF